MSRTIRPLLAGILTATIALSGCAAQVGAAAVGGNAGPAVVSSEGADPGTSTPTVVQTSGSDVITPSDDPTSSDPTAGEPTSSDPTSDEPTSSDPTESPTETSAGSADPGVQQFIALIKDGMSGVTSYEGKISTDMGNSSEGSMTGTMRGTVKDGKAENSEANIGIAIGSQSVEVKLLMVGTKTYLGGSTLLTAIPEAKGKTWIYADPNSSNPKIKQLASTMSAAGSSGNSSIESFTKFAEAAKSVKKGESSTVNGIETTAYTVELDTAKLGSSVATAGSATATFALDGDNRMRRAKIEVEASGIKVVVNMDMTDYNAPVDISAPAADTVYTG